MRLIKNLRDRLRDNRAERRDKLNKAKDRLEAYFLIFIIILSIICVLICYFSSYSTASKSIDNSTAVEDTPIAQATRTYGKTIVTKINRIHDGDTLNVTISDWPPIVGTDIPIRISGIDTPEMSSKDPKIKSLALKAKNHLMYLLANGKVIELRNIKRDKYFRLDAELYIDNADVAADMIKLGLAKQYNGGTKSPWTSN